MAFLQVLALLTTTTLLSGASAQCLSDPEVDLCPFVAGYDNQPPLFSSPGCPDDPDSDLCDGVSPSPSPAGMCPDDPDSDLCGFFKPGTCPDDPESDLCDGKVWMPCPDDPDVDLCVPTPVPSPSPSPSPAPVAPSPSPSPTPVAPSPTPSPTSEGNAETTTTTTVIIKVASFDTALEMDDVTKFDAAKFVESVTSSQDAAEEVVVESVSYQVEVEYTLPETMTETNVREAISAAQNVPLDNVNATKKSARRLAASLRRLQAAWDVVIKTSDASAVDNIATKAEDNVAIQQAAENLGISGVIVEVASPPKKKVAVQFKVKSKPDAVAPVQTIDAAELSTELGDKLGVEVTVGPVDFKGEEEEVKSPPPSPPTPSPSPTPSPTPSASPSPSPAPSPTPGKTGSTEDDGSKTLSCLFAVQLALASTIAGVSLF